MLRWTSKRETGVEEEVGLWGSDLHDISLSCPKIGDQKQPALILLSC